MTVRTGLEVALAEGLSVLRGQRVGLLTHAAGLTRDLRSTVSVLRAALGDRLVALFSPEHGLESAMPDAVGVASRFDPRYQLPVYSLYGPSLRPPPEAMANLDAIIVDLQDVGVRFYTYLWTVSYVLESAAQAGVRVILLDRPNPLGGKVQGPLLEAGFSSFVGRFSIALRHGLTLGEAALLLNERFNLKAHIELVPLQGWRRDMDWSQTGLIWTPPSPGLPTIDAVRVYPGTCLVEGTNLSEGRGTNQWC